MTGLKGVKYVVICYLDSGEGLFASPKKEVQQPYLIFAIFRDLLFFSVLKLQSEVES